MAGWASVKGFVGVRKKGDRGSADVVQGAVLFALPTHPNPYSLSSERPLGREA